MARRSMPKGDRAPKAVSARRDPSRPVSVGPYELLDRRPGYGHPDLTLARRRDDVLGGTFDLLLARRERLLRNGRLDDVVTRARHGMTVRHPALARVRDVLTEGEWLAVVADHVPGRPLSELFEAAPEPTEADRPARIALAALLLEALADIHALKDPEGDPVHHGYVTASNVVAMSAREVRLTGFGMPLDHGPEALDWGTVADRPAIDAHLGTLDDQFAVGLILLRLILGSGYDKTIDQASGPAQADALRWTIGSVPLEDPVLPVLLRLLAVEPRHRFSSARGAAKALRHLGGPAQERALHAFIELLLVRDSTQETLHPAEDTLEELSLLQETVEDDDAAVTEPGAAPPAPGRRSRPKAPPVALAPFEPRPAVPQVLAAPRAAVDDEPRLSDSLMSGDSQLLDESSEGGRGSSPGRAAPSSTPAAAAPASAPTPAGMAPDASADGEWDVDPVEPPRDPSAGFEPSLSTSGRRGNNQSRPGKTVPYSPAFVPKASTWRKGTPNLGPAPAGEPQRHTDKLQANQAIAAAADHKLVVPAGLFSSLPEMPVVRPGPAALHVPPDGRPPTVSASGQSGHEVERVPVRARRPSVPAVPTLSRPGAAPPVALSSPGVERPIYHTRKAVPTAGALAREASQQTLPPVPAGGPRSAPAAPSAPPSAGSSPEGPPPEGSPLGGSSPAAASFATTGAPGGASDPSAAGAAGQPPSRQLRRKRKARKGRQQRADTTAERKGGKTRGRSRAAGGEGKPRRPGETRGPVADARRRRRAVEGRSGTAAGAEGRPPRRRRRPKKPQWKRTLARAAPWLVLTAALFLLLTVLLVLRRVRAPEPTTGARAGASPVGALDVPEPGEGG